MATDISRRPYRFTVADYERMGEAGILTEDDRVELINGEIIEMSPIGIRHMRCVNRTGRLAERSIGDEYEVSVQNPIRLSNDGMPQPDIAIFPAQDDDAPMPTDDEVLVVIEVADSTRNFDRHTKLPLYAAAGIPEAWLFDLIGETIERHTQPADGRYTLIAVAGRGQALTSTVLPGLTIPANIIPKRQPGDPE
jgi:Uma2 family endonuclease